MVRLRNGRWSSRDPIEEAGGDNLYAFVENNPISWVDILGNASSRRGWNPPGRPGPNSSASAAANDAINGFFNGTDNINREYGPDHPWTISISEHRHMDKVRKNIKSDILSHCFGGKDRTGTTAVPFSLNRQTILTNAQMFLRDILAGMNILSPEHSMGSFYMEQTINSIDCNSCSADVTFVASDRLRLGSFTRIHMTSIQLAEDRNEPNVPFNTISLKWTWAETVKRVTRRAPRHGG